MPGRNHSVTALKGHYHPASQHQSCRLAEEEKEEEEGGDKAPHILLLRSASTEQWDQHPAESHKHIHGWIDRAAVDGLDNSHAASLNEQA